MAFGAADSRWSGCLKNIQVAAALTAINPKTETVFVVMRLSIFLPNQWNEIQEIFPGVDQTS